MRRITAIAAGGNHSVALTVGGSLVVFGRNKHGALGTGDNQNIWSPTKIRMALPGESEADLRAVQVVCGDSHTMALVMNRGCMEIRTTGARPRSSYCNVLSLCMSWLVMLLYRVQ